METYIILAQAGVPTTVIGGQAAPAATGAEVGVVEQAAPQGLFGGFGWNWILIYIVIFGGYIWFVMRKNKKKQQEVVDMREALKVGDEVCTTGGLMGKVVDIKENTFVIEFGTNKGVLIPVVKSEVVALPPSENAGDK